MNEKLEMKLKALKRLDEMLAEFEKDLPEEMRTVVTPETVAAERMFLQEMKAANINDPQAPVLKNFHVTWGPQAKDMCREQLLASLREWDRAVQNKEYIDIGPPRCKRAPVDVRDLVEKL